MSKVYVDTVVRMNKNGQMMPLEIIWEDGRVFSIDKIINIRRAVSIKSGGIGIRYQCMIRDTAVYLFLEGEKWFFEKC